MEWLSQGGPMVGAIILTDAFVLALGALGLLLSLGARRAGWLLLPARLYALLLLLACATPMFEGIIGYWLERSAARSTGVTVSSAALWVGLVSTLGCGVVASVVVMISALPPPHQR